MGKDFRIGLILGVVLAVAALLWVATRPSLTSQAQTPRASRADVRVDSPSHNTMPWEDANTADSGRGANPQSAISNPQSAASSPPVKESVIRYPPSEQAASPNALPDLTIYEKGEKIKTTKFHIVLRGESLAGIARQYYGSPDGWRKILKANQKTIKDPNKLAPGTKLIIPE